MPQGDQPNRSRLEAGAQAGIFYFSTFHGGDSAAWAPQTDSFARFDAFRIGTSLSAVSDPRRGS